MDERHFIGEGLPKEETAFEEALVLQKGKMVEVSNPDFQ